jgi:hypothetical protein
VFSLSLLKPNLKWEILEVGTPEGKFTLNLRLNAKKTMRHLQPEAEHP